MQKFSRVPGPLPTRPNTAFKFPLPRKEAVTAAGFDGAVMLGVLLFGAAARFVNHLLIYPFYFIYAALLGRQVLKSGGFKNFTPFAPIVVLALVTAAGAVFANQYTTANYFLFICVIFFSIAVAPNCFAAGSVDSTRILGILYIALVLPFLIYRPLEGMGSRVLSIYEVQGALYTEVDASRRTAFFYHTNEFALYSTALFIFMLTSFSAHSRKRREKFIDYFILALVLLCVASTKSTTAVVLVMLALVKYFTRTRLADMAFFAGLAMLTIGQLFYAREIAHVLVSGSFWWRFDTAAHIMRVVTYLIAFTPGLVDRIGLISWPHSVILDYVLVYGLLGGFVPLLTVVLCASFRGTRFYIGWLAAFLLVSSTQPIGAMPIPYLALAIAIGCAEQAQIARRAAEPKPAKKKLIRVQA